jgi:hypothetical protein
MRLYYIFVTCNNEFFDFEKTLMPSPSSVIFCCHVRGTPPPPPPPANTAMMATSLLTFLVSLLSVRQVESTLWRMVPLYRK